MDKRTIEALEYDEIKEKLCGYARSNDSKQACMQMSPWATYDDIKESLAETVEAFNFYKTNGDIPVYENDDVSQFVEKAALSSLLKGKELLRVTGYLKSFDAITSLFTGTEEIYPILWKSVQLIPNCKDIIAEVEKVLESDGSVKSDASSELMKIRKQISTTLNKIEKTYDKLLNSPTYGKMFQDEIITKINDRYVILLKTQYRNQFPSRVMGRSDSGESLYVEHMDVIGLNNDYYMYQQLEIKEIEKILMQLTQKIGEKANGIRRGISQINKLDFIFAKAKLSKSWNGSKPALSQNPLFDLKDARHPLISGTEVIPISAHLGKDFRTMVITGPNTGGKTVTLKTVGLLIALTYSGILIPASPDSIVGWYTDVLADIGEEQSIQQSLSSFSAHMNRIIDIVHKTHPTTLVLIDELGSGTDPEEGAALGMALIAHLHREKVPLLVTTHLPLIKSFAYEYEDATNASVGFDLTSLAPTYVLYIGSPGSSQAFEISKRLGMSQELLGTAEKYLDTKAVYTRKLMNNIHKKKEEITNTLQETKTLKDTIQKQKEYYESEIEKIETKYKAKYENDRRKFQSEMQGYMQQAKEVLSNLSRQQKHSREAEELLHTMKKLENDVEGTKSPSGFDEQSSSTFTEATTEETSEVTTQPVERARDIEIGDFVFIPAIQKEAIVVKKIPRSKKVEVQYGQWRQTLPYKDIELILKEETTKEPEVEIKTDSIPTFSEDLSERVDIHGFHIEEALPYLDKYLDQAYMAKFPQIYIVHGAGTGALREAVIEFLKKHPHIKSMQPGEKTTVAYLR